MESVYVTPFVGVGYTHRSGFHIGADVGWQFTRLQKEEFTPRVHSEEAKLRRIEEDEDYRELTERMWKAGRFYGSVSPPHLTLVRIGWWF